MPGPTTNSPHNLKPAIASHHGLPPLLHLATSPPRRRIIAQHTISPPSKRLDAASPQHLIAHHLVKPSPSTNSTNPQSHRPHKQLKRKMDLPVELWMRVFEHLEFDHRYARQRCIERYEDALEGNTPSDGNKDHHDHVTARKALPHFEQQGWLSSRALYIINRTSRAAALRLRLSHRLLYTYKRPIQLHRNMLEATKHSPNPSSVVAVQPFNCQLFHCAVTIKFSKDDEFFEREIVRLMEVVTATKPNTEFPGYSLDVTRKALYPLRIAYLETARHVMILATPGCGSCSDQYRLRLATIVKDAIVKFWAEDGIFDRRVEVFL